MEAIQLPVIHKNPPATMLHSGGLRQYSKYTLEGCYAGQNQFWAYKSNPNDSNAAFITFRFTPPVILTRYVIFFLFYCLVLFHFYIYFPILSKFYDQKWEHISPVRSHPSQFTHSNKEG